MKKLDYKTAFKNTSMFLVNDTIEDHYEGYLEDRIKILKQSLLNVHTVDGLESYIRTDPDSINNIITLLGISGEKFKRIVSWIRLNQGFTFESEWSNIKLRNELLGNKDLMRDYCELFSSGNSTKKFMEIVPRFILSDFKIDKDTVARLLNDDYVRNLVKDKIFTEYNARYCDFYYSELFKKIDEISNSFGLEFNRYLKIPEISGISLKGIDYNKKSIIINSHFYLTTSSNQTKYYNDIIKTIFQGARINENIKVINILDGAGWIGRSSDYKKIYQDCDYFLNIKTIDNLQEIIKEHFKI